MRPSAVDLGLGAQAMLVAPKDLCLTNRQLMAVTMGLPLLSAGASGVLCSVAT